MKVKVFITLRAGVADPQGREIGTALRSLGFAGVGEPRMGKYLEFDLADCLNPEEQIKDMCDKLLANPATEQAEFQIIRA